LFMSFIRGAWSIGKAAGKNKVRVLHVTIWRGLFLSIICWIASQFQLHAQQKFPEWRGSNTQLAGMWLNSPIVAVGEVVNITSYGEQSVENIPWPMFPGVHRLYWCEGEFRAKAVVKGSLPLQGKKYLWGSGQSGCKLWDDNPRLMAYRARTRAWFLREEGDVLRPTFDGGTPYFISVLAKWDDASPLPVRRQLGVLLLTPRANCDTLDDYANYIWSAADIACELLDNNECEGRIRAFLKSKNVALRKSACDYLRAQRGELCVPK